MLITYGLIAWVLMVVWSPGEDRPAGSDLLAAQGVSASDDGDFMFFSFRRGIWRVQKSTSTIRYFNFPEPGADRGDRESIVGSRSHQFDTDEFPLDQVQFQLSSKNLTNYLWVTNPTTGKAFFVKARRDNDVEVSDTLTVSE